MPGFIKSLHNMSTRENFPAPFASFLPNWFSILNFSCLSFQGGKGMLHITLISIEHISIFYCMYSIRPLELKWKGQTNENEYNWNGNDFTGLLSLQLCHCHLPAYILYNSKFNSVKFSQFKTNKCVCFVCTLYRYINIYNCFFFS